jgi:hypothetical protein
MKSFSFSERGGHLTNEDAFAIHPHPLESGCYLGTVADGQGGRAGGAAAAQEVCRAFIELAGRMPLKNLVLPKVLTGILQAIDRAVCDHPQAGFTTLVAFLITDTFLWGTSNGDSAALVANANQPANILTARQMKDPPVGSGAAAFVNFASPLVAPWTVLAMTDGVWKYVGWENILKEIVDRSGEEIIDSLRERARLPRTGQFQDDFTLLVFQQDAP